MNQAVRAPSDGSASGDPQIDQTRPQSRARFIRGIAAVGDALAAGAATWALPRLSDAAPSAQQEREVLELYLVELTEQALYSQALEQGRFRGELLEYVKVVGAQERDHVRFLRKALGSGAPAPPRFDFGAATRSRDAFVARAIALEDLSVAAYNGQGTNVSRKTLAAAARIASVEGRHAAWIRSIVGERPAPAATEPSRTEAQVRSGLARLGVQGA
jgi:Ferritin-like domain